MKSSSCELSRYQNLPKESSNIGGDEGDPIVVAELVDLDLLAQGGVCQNNDLELLDHVGGDLSFPFQQCYGYVAVQLGKAGYGHLSSGLANIGFPKEEL